MKRTVTMVVCDAPHEAPVPAVGKAALDVDGDRYTLDLCQDDLDSFKEVMAHYRAAAHKAQRAKPKPKAARKAKRKTPAPEVVRAWASENGVEVSPRGRVPAAVVEAYEARNGS